MKNSKFRSPFEKQVPYGVKFITKQQVFTHRTLTHMTDLMTYPYTTSHISFKSQVFSSLLTTWCDPQRSVSPWSAWRLQASAPRRSRRRLVCRRRQRSAGCGGCARTATWRRTTSGDRVVRRLVRVSCFSCYLSHIARIVMCASRLLVHGCKKERVRAAALTNTWISVEPCCTVAGVRKDVCRRLASSPAAAASKCYASFHTPWHSPQTPTARRRQTTRGKTCCFVTHIPNRNFDPPSTSKWAKESQKLNFDLHVFSFSSTTVPQMVEKNSAKMRRIESLKNYAFSTCALFLKREARSCETVSQTTCILGRSTGCFI